jgi:hypothetical protein
MLSGRNPSSLDIDSTYSCAWSRPGRDGSPIAAMRSIAARRCRKPKLYTWKEFNLGFAKGDTCEGHHSRIGFQNLPTLIRQLANFVLTSNVGLLGELIHCWLMFVSCLAPPQSCMADGMRAAKVGL